MDIIFSASIIAAFFAGMVALFAPCCITVLLPAYLASAFKERKHILKMTFIFFAGIAVILVPIGLGAAGLAQIFQDFHREMYIIGGTLMILLAGLAVSGRGLSLPLPKRWAPKLDAGSGKSVFLLGVFSGAATSCCAPVLAGAMTLAVISGAFWKALIVVFAYVFGMTFPLFVAAYFYDRFQLDQSQLIQGKLLTWRIGGKIFRFHTTNLLAGVIFFLVGAILLTLAFSNNAFWAPATQARFGTALNVWSGQLLDWALTVPEFIWGVIIVGLFGWLFYQASRPRLVKGKPDELACEHHDHNHSCH